MAVLTANVSVRDDLLRKVDNFAKNEATSREELINSVIEAYVRRKEFEKVCDSWSDLASKPGFAEEDINEEVRQYREERKGRSK